jgi:hypothetical protein
MNLNIETIFKKRRAATTRDVVGLELGAGLPQGVPMVRLQTKRRKVELMAAGFVKLDDTLPVSPETASRLTGCWSLPKPFQAHKAAIAVTSPLTTLRQTSSSGAKEDAETLTRKVSVTTDRQHPPLVSFMPDFLASWCATRFPEGRRPTARSIQTSTSSALNCFLTGPVSLSSNNPAIAIFCFGYHSSIAAFYEGRLLLYREHPVGYLTVQEAVCKKMGIDPEIADTMMNDHVVDISTVTEPILSTLCRQADISADYLSRRKNCVVNAFYVYGIPSGVKQWTTAFLSTVGKPLNHLHPFGGIACSHRHLSLPESFEKDAPLFMSAIGAARALLEDQ